MSEERSEENTVALVTGANRGIGQAFVQTLLDRGAKRIYVGARNADDALDIAAPDPARIIPLTLDITDEAQVRSAVAKAGDINLLVNNAGVAHFAGVYAAPTLDDARSEMDVNYFGTMAMCRAFAPVLEKNGGGGIINIVSIVGLVSTPVAGSYSASKAALHSMTISLREELRGQKTNVVAVYPGPVQTRMIKPIEDAMQDSMVTPDIIAAASLDGLHAGETEVFPGTAADIRQGLIADPAAVQAQFAQLLPEAPAA